MAGHPEKNADLISVIIPNYNGRPTIGKCLEAAFSSNYPNFEVIVVDDCSGDGSKDEIKNFPCTLIELKAHSGASKARNTGALNSNGKILFFTDSDCLLNEDTLSIAYKTLMENGPDFIAGGTYTPVPYDKGFFGAFQSVFINYSETKKKDNPDYIATHAMALYADTFRKSEGFPEDFLPILEDVEFSHRMRRAGHKLRMNPDMLVRHIFDYSLAGSLRNAYRKSMYWMMYSVMNRDLFADSGTASVELKANGASYFFAVSVIVLQAFIHKPLLLYLIPILIGLNIFINRGLIRAFYKAKGGAFALAAALYYMFVYPVAVGAGAASGMMKLLSFRLSEGKRK
jgi:glycosyltransferase involved in cell wall biosynthesis